MINSPYLSIWWPQFFYNSNFCRFPSVRVPESFQLRGLRPAYIHRRDGNDGRAAGKRLAASSGQIICHEYIWAFSCCRIHLQRSTDRYLDLSRLKLDGIGHWNFINKSANHIKRERSGWNCMTNDEVPDTWSSFTSCFPPETCVSVERRYAEWRVT